MVNNSTQQPNKNGRGKDRNGRTMHPNSLKNLEKRVSWKPGQQGRHKGMTITQRQQQMMAEVCLFDREGKTWLDSLAEGGMRQSLTIPSALSNLQDRHEGKVTIPIGGEGGEPLSIEIIVSSDTAKKLTEAIIKGENT